MNDVTLIGLGKNGYRVGRGAAKRSPPSVGMEPKCGAPQHVGRKGRGYAATVVAAVQASDVVMLSLSDYPAMDAVLRRGAVIPYLRGKTIIQLSSGTPRKRVKLRPGLSKLVRPIWTERSLAIRRTSGRVVPRSSSRVRINDPDHYRL